MIDLFWLGGLPVLFLVGFVAAKQPSAPPPPPPPPQKSDAEIQAEKAQARFAIRRRRGRQASILGGEQRFLAPSGDDEKAETLGA